MLDVWAPNQAPSVIKIIGARLTNLADEKINVHTTFLGGGFGRRIEPDFSDYAIRIAMETEGRPVKGHLDTRGGHEPRALSPGSAGQIPRPPRQ